MKTIIVVVVALLFCGCLDPFSPLANATENFIPGKYATEEMIDPAKTLYCIDPIYFSGEYSIETLPRLDNYNPNAPHPTSDTARTNPTGPTSPEPASGK